MVGLVPRHQPKKDTLEMLGIDIGIGMPCQIPP